MKTSRLPTVSWPCSHVPRAEPQDNAGAEGGDQAGAETVQAAEERAALLRTNRGLGELLEACLLAILLHKGLHHRDARQRLLNVRLHAAFDLPLVLGCYLQRLADQERSPDH